MRIEASRSQGHVRVDELKQAGERLRTLVLVHGAVHDPEDEQ